MNFKLALAAIALSAFALTACTKKEEAPATGTTAEAPAEVAISAEQQAAIDSVDQPMPEAIAIDETVVAEAAAENVAAEAEKNGAAETVEAATAPEAAAESETQAQ